MLKFYSLFGLILANGEKSNVLVILLDDLGWADVSWNNHKVVATPFMEEMARNGTILVRSLFQHIKLTVELNFLNHLGTILFMLVVKSVNRLYPVGATVGPNANLARVLDHFLFTNNW